MGFLTKRIKDKSKREKIMMIVGICEILALVFFGLTQRWGWEEGYNTCVNNFCTNIIGTYSNFSIQTACMNYTKVNVSEKYCEGSDCIP